MGSTPGKICQDPMDLEDVGGIRTTSIPRLTASSNEPNNNQIGRITSNQPWIPTEEDSTEPWIQIEFDDEPVYIFGLVIKGAGPDTNKFVTKVRVESKLSETDEEWNLISTTSGEPTFEANTDDDNMASIYFPENQPILATVVRIHPVEWEGDEPAVRVGLLGCFKMVETTTTEKPKKTIPATEPATTPAATTTTTPIEIVTTTKRTPVYTETTTVSTTSQGVVTSRQTTTSKSVPETTVSTVVVTTSPAVEPTTTAPEEVVSTTEEVMTTPTGPVLVTTTKTSTTSAVEIVTTPEATTTPESEPTTAPMVEPTTAPVEPTTAPMVETTTVEVTVVKTTPVVTEPAATTTPAVVVDTTTTKTVTTAPLEPTTEEPVATTTVVDTTKVVETTTVKKTTTTPLTTTTKAAVKECADEVVVLTQYTGLPIPDSVYTASSNVEYAAESKTVLDTNKAVTEFWAPSATDEEPFIQIKFDTRVTVVQLLVQGSFGSDQWTETFEMTYTTSSDVNNAAVWEPATNADGSLIFIGNSEDRQIVTVDMTSPISDVTAIRVYPKTSGGAGADDGEVSIPNPALRVDVAGCYEERAVVTTTKTVTTETTGAVQTTTTAPVVVPEKTTTPSAPVETTTPSAPEETTTPAPVVEVTTTVEEKPTTTTVMTTTSKAVMDTTTTLPVRTTTTRETVETTTPPPTPRPPS